MVDTAYIRSRASRYDTAVARAFRRALGMPEHMALPHGAASRGRGHYGGMYRHMGECFRNRRHVNF